MDKAREEVMEEIRENPTIREQMKEIQDQLNQANVSGSAKVDVVAE